jgi:sugar transferase (PEP-CTERM/EpsH1 system associated)
MPPVSPSRTTVCQVLHTLHIGGAEVLVARLTRRMRERYRFVFVCLDDIGTLGEELRSEGFPVFVVERKPGLDWRCPWRLARFLRQERVDLIQAHQYTPFFYALLARLIYRQPPILFTEHGRHQPDYPRRKRMIANRLLLRQRDRVVGVGEAVRQALIVNEGIPPGRAQVVYNGIDVDAFTPRTHQREAAVRDELGLGPDDLVLLQVARLDYLKDHLTAVRTIGRVATRVPSVRLILVGEGPERLAIQAEVERLGLAQHIRFLGLRKDVGQLLQGADLFLLTSISEGIPLTVIEAMATSLPVVATRVGGMEEVVVEGETGYLAPAKDDAALAEAVLKLAASPKLRRHLGERGRQRACSLFSEAAMAERYGVLYEEMLRG